MTAVRETVDALVGHLAQLRAALGPGSTGGGRSSGKPGSRPPLRVGVFDELADVTGLVDDVAQRLRDRLGFAHRLTPVDVTLRALPVLVDALDRNDPLRAAVAEALDDARRHARSVLELDPPRLRLAAACPECGAATLLADPEAGAVWCRDRACGYECGRDGCLCVDPDRPRLHRYKWGRDDLVRLGQMVEPSPPP